MHSQKFKAAIPLLLLLALLGLFWQQLFYSKRDELPSPLVGKPLPQFNLPNMLLPDLTFTNAQLKGKVSLLNVWATWCSACYAEHPMLMKIKK